MKDINLIGISGRSGSGKDTVAGMIQFVNYKKGFAQVGGWNTNYEFVNWSELNLMQSDWEIKKFAGVLKQTASLLTGISVDKFEDQEFKKTKLGDEWDGMTVREFLQRLGTEGLRTGLHENVWVNALFAEFCNVEAYSDLGNLSQNIKYPKWIVTDVRFPNEMEAIKKHGGINIRLTRNSLTTSSHTSETALDYRDDWDYVIYNDKVSLEETFNDVVKMVDSFNL